MKNKAEAKATMRAFLTTMYDSTIEEVLEELKAKLEFLQKDTNIRPEEVAGYRTAMAYVEAMIHRAPDPGVEPEKAKDVP